MFFVDDKYAEFRRLFRDHDDHRACGAGDVTGLQIAGIAMRG
jgi:hypothetical protein